MITAGPGRCRGTAPNGCAGASSGRQHGFATGSIRARASKYSLCSRMWGDVPSSDFQDDQHGRSPPEVEQSLAIGGYVLVGAGARAEDVAQFIVSATEPGG